MAKVNVEGTRRVLDAAAAVGARKVVLMSSATVYGAWPNNPVPLTEDAPLRPNPEFPPAVQTAEVERLLADWRREHPGVAVVTLRPAPVLGAGAAHLLARILAAGPTVGVRAAATPVPGVHVDDGAAALVRACATDLVGVYNVAADRWLEADDAAALRARRVRVALPERLARGLLGASWASGLGDVPPGVVPYLMSPWVVANDRLRSSGWMPTSSNEEALLATAEALPSPALWPWAAAATAGIAAAALGASALRQRRRCTISASQR